MVQCNEALDVDGSESVVIEVHLRNGILLSVRFVFGLDGVVWTIFIFSTK